MPQDDQDRIHADDAPDVLAFAHDDGIALGLAGLERMRADGLVGAVTVMRGAQRVFHAGLAGSSHDLDLWLDRKVRVVQMYDRPSYAVKGVFQEQGRDFATQSLHDPRELMAAGGGVPIRIAGAMVGVIALSGWHEQGEHALGVELVSDLAARQRAERDR